MTIGLFLDVDNTLTKGFIQHCYAKMLGVDEEFLKIENKYQTKTISSGEFGEELIELFNLTQFNEEFAKQNFDKIPLKDSADSLLRCRSTSIVIYFVSSGPNYYVERLAKKYNIPDENVLCSEYIFGRDGKLVGCNAKASRQKHNFREQHMSKHHLTIGVGDDELHDKSFLDGCDIGLLTPKTGEAGKAVSDEHLWAPKLALIEALITRLDRKIQTSAY